MSQPDTSPASASSGVLATEIDWIVTALLVLSGLLAGVVGVGANRVANRDEIRQLVADGTIESDMLTNAELVDVTYALLWWGGLGVALIGVLLAGVGVVYLLYRRRARRRRAERGVTGPATTTNAFVGAVVTVVVSFLPFSPLFGGGVAGYLQSGDTRTGAKVGALSGLIASIPVVVLFLFLIGGAFVVSAELSVGFGAGFVSIALLVALFGAVVYLVGVSAVGGYVGVYLTRDEGTEPTGD